MILSDLDIIPLAEAGMIAPFEPKQTAKGRVSHGLSCAGYDLRLGCMFRVPSDHALPVDPMNVQEDDFLRIEEDDSYIIPPHGFVLAETLERLDLPTDIVGLLKDKSTYARLGISVFNTVFEPGWRGRPTIEITNHSPFSVRLHVGQGIAQMLFLETTSECGTPYNGKYQDQTGVTLAKVLPHE